MKEMDKRERSLEASSFQSYDLNIYDWPFRGEVTGFFRRWKGFQPQAALPGFNSCRKLFIPLSATGLESGCRGYNHFVSKVSPWCAFPILALVKLGWNFFCSSSKVFEFKCPEAHGLGITNMNLYPGKPRVDLYWEECCNALNEKRSKEHPGGVWELFQETEECFL